jgi:hypothetical protein
MRTALTRLQGRTGETETENEQEQNLDHLPPRKALPRHPAHEAISRNAIQTSIDPDLHSLHDLHNGASYLLDGMKVEMKEASHTTITLVVRYNGNCPLSL